MKTSVFLKKKLYFEGSGESPEQQKGTLFPLGVEGAPLGATLSDFCEFWATPPGPNGLRFPPFFFWRSKMDATN